MKGSEVRVENVTKTFGDFTALDTVSLQIKKGEYFSLLGPSGCGKTTLLRIIAGFEDPTGGMLYLDGKDMSGVPSNKRHVNTVFQNYALFPHLSVYENIAFPLRLKKKPQAEIHRRVTECLELVKLPAEGKKKPDQLSGGQKQRVAIARALINQPSVLLLDEPLAALDAKLRQHMLIELDAIHDTVGITFIYVTHDQQEALSVSDRIAVMNEGAVLQVGSPQEIYETPSNAFVAQFIGEANFLNGTVESILEDSLVRINTESIGPVIIYKDKDVAPGDRVKFAIRPEKIRITVEMPRQESGNRIISFHGIVDEIIYTGFLSKYFVTIGNSFVFKVFKQHLRFALDEKPIPWKSPVSIWWHADDGYIVEVEHP